MGPDVRRSKRAGSAWLVAVTALLSVCLAACSSGSPESSASSSAAGGTAAAGAPAAVGSTIPAPPTSLSLSDEACAAATATDCPLKEAAARSGLTIGTAGKFSSSPREALQAEQFSALSAEYQLLWSVVERERGQWDFTGADQVVAFAHQHGLPLTATHFVWDPPGKLSDVVPPWVLEIDDPAELWQALRDYFTAVTQRYGDQIIRWDAVNEPLSLTGTLEDNHFRRVLGPDYVAQAFRLAHEIAPGAQLFLNDWGAEYIPAKAEGLVALAARLVHDGVPISGVGLQAHLEHGDPNWELFERTLRQLSDLGLTVVISELDLALQDADPDPLEAQATRAARVVRLCLQTPHCDQITFWGFDDGDTWLDGYLRPGTRPLLFDADLRPKPMFFAVRRALLGLDEKSSFVGST